MISPSSHYHRAYLDEDGNIMLPEEDSSTDTKQEETPVVLEEETVFVAAEIPHDSFVQTALNQSRDHMSSALQEGVNQYKYSFGSSRKTLKDISLKAKNVPTKMWSFLAQPVWIPRKNKEAKQYSRGTLFVLDIVRFGGTFAVLFGGLFVTLNYQSFWQMVQPHIDPLHASASVNALSASVDQQLRDKLLKSPGLATAGEEEGSLLSYLPAVGPPENRLIIPKLGINVPLVTPSYEALLREDWEQVEEDIQDALQMGVVHYPGTARPGQAGNFFLTGHSSYYPWAPGNYKNIFARLHELNIGDEYWVYYNGDKHRYIIEGEKEVKPSDVTVLDQPLGNRMGTLMTCTPVGTTLRRLILTAQEVDVVTGQPLEVGEQSERDVPQVQMQMLPI